MEQERIHFIGIGGAGMSAIATVLLEMGVPVSGSDLKESANSRRLAELGARIAIGHRPQNIEDASTVVISSAIPDSNPELAAARESGIEVLIRAEMLARLGRRKKTLAVAGTHGKTTTTSMIALVLERAGLEPTFLIGGELNDIGSNAKHGAGEYLVAEADESDGSFLHLAPHIAVVTNVEADHLDHYDSFEQIKETFARFLSKLPPDGAAIVCGDDAALLEIARACAPIVVSYGFAAHNDYRATDPAALNGGGKFEVTERGSRLGPVRLKVPGDHNMANALATIAAARLLGLEFDAIAGVLAEFSGVKRRFQHIGCLGQVTVVDDYAHHPTEVRATLAAAKGGEWRRVVCVFQPHRFSRTRLLGSEFGRAFDEADVVVLTDVYGAGEEPEPGVSGKLLVDAVLRRSPRAQVAYIPKRGDIASFLRSSVRGGDLVITMGAGDVWTCGPELLEALEGEGEGSEATP
ncbi:MAG: UDP-N-acetylmuramate--L-alanine ligase [Actinobacteria bacterium]|nr:MAG: UDP-N-acetylmuramate--L-alanine ligase [Actinomycetota bacterium]